MSFRHLLVVAALATVACGGPVSGVDAGTSLCGDGRVEGAEICDSGAANSDSEPDACRTTCVPAHCGDGVLDRGEACDGTAPKGANCSVSCRIVICGNRLVEEGEQCDDGDANDDTRPGACRRDCRLARCGDGAVDPGESCDDGNTTAGDGCSATCAVEGVDAVRGAPCGTVGQRAGGLVCVDPGSDVPRWFTPCETDADCLSAWDHCGGAVPVGGTVRALGCIPNRCADPGSHCTCAPSHSGLAEKCWRSGDVPAGSVCENERGAFCAPGLACIAEAAAPLMSCARDADCADAAPEAYCTATNTCAARGRCEDWCSAWRISADSGCDDDRATCVPVDGALGACRVRAPVEGGLCAREGAVVAGLRCSAANDGLRWSVSCAGDGDCRPFQQCDAEVHVCLDTWCDVLWAGGESCVPTRDGLPAYWSPGALPEGQTCRLDAGTAEGRCARGLACIILPGNQGGSCTSDAGCAGGYCDGISHRCATFGTCRATCDVAQPSLGSCDLLGVPAACVPTGSGWQIDLPLGICTPETEGDDPFFANQWHLVATADNHGRTGEDAHVQTAWNQGIRGEGVTIGIVDDGLEIAHEDLRANVLPGLSHDYVTGGTDPTGGDHGTAVAGVAAARDLNGKGVRGVAPRAGLVGLNVLQSDETSNELDAETRLGDVVDVYNNSWGPPDGSAQLMDSEPLWRQAIEYGLAHGRAGRGSVYVWAAGNGGEYGENSNYDGYANYHGVMAIGAVGADGRRSGYSERGANVWLCTPSQGSRLGITTTDRTGSLGYNDGADPHDLGDSAYTNAFGGTSSATPVAAGAAALVLQANPRLTWRDVKAVLANTARKNDPTGTGWAVNGAGHPVSVDCGFGVVDVAAAVEAARTWPLLPAQKTFVTPRTAPGLAIPDDDVRGVHSQIRVAGSGIAKIEFVAVRFTSDHSYAGDLEIVLRNEATGTESVLATRHECAGPCAPYDDWRFGSARHLDEAADGVWSLSVRDTSADDSGRFVSWQLVFYGH